MVKHGEWRLVGVLLAAALVAGCQQRTDPTWQRVGESPIGDVQVGEPVGHYHPRTWLPPGVSAWVMVGTLATLGGLLGAAVWLARRYRAQARLEEAFDHGAPPADGHVVVFGRVEAEGADPVVRVRIVQEGREHRTRNGRMHTWTEISRSVLARPFHLVLTHGGRVRVEPGERPVLAGEFSRTERQAVDLRTHVAEIHPGQSVHITRGFLRGLHTAVNSPYRGAPTEPLLRPAPGAVMEISVERPGATAARMARLHTLAAVVLAATLVSVLAVARVYCTTVVDGVTMRLPATATALWYQWVQPKGQVGRWEPHHAVQVAYDPDDGRPPRALVEECSADLALCVQGGLCPTVPFVVAPHVPGAFTVGDRPALSDLRAMYAVAAALVALLAYVAIALDRRPWYVKSRLRSSGSGRLADVP